MGQGTPCRTTTVTLHMQTTDDLIVVTNDTFLNLTITFSGGDLALRACLPAFTFRLLASTPDANGNLGLGGYLWSDGTVFIPSKFSPASANYTTLPLTCSNARSARIYANFFTDGSLRITGYQGVAIPAGVYTTAPACIVYNARKNPLPPPRNVLISDASCLSDVTGINIIQNFETYVGNYYEYFALDWYNGNAYIVGNENCYPGSHNGSRWFNGTMLSSFYRYKLGTGGVLSRVSYIPTIDRSNDGQTRLVGIWLAA
jgi:hypothetical protein